jgi:hypothetical protein
MDDHVHAYFRSFASDTQPGNFHQVLALHEPSSELTWKATKRLVPNFPKGWHELCRLSSKDRVEFVRDFWMSALPFQPGFQTFIDRWFSSLADVGIYVTQRTFESPYESHFVYCLKRDKGFFQAKPPVSEADIVALQKLFGDVVLPADYLAFLRIHDGFSKFTDTGIIPSPYIGRVYRDFQAKLSEKEPLVSATGEGVNPKTLIPFYESFGFPCFQCFWGEWYPAQEMGNVYYSGLTHTITDHTSGVASPENQAFPTFLDWLMFYLEIIEA